MNETPNMNSENIINLLKGLSAKLEVETQKDQTFRTKITSELTSLNNVIITINSELSSVLDQVQNIQNTFDNNTTLVNELQTNLTALEEEKTQIQNKLNDIISEKQNIETQLGEQKAVVQQKEVDLKRLTVEKESAEAEYKTTSELLAKGNTTQQEMNDKIEKLGQEHDTKIETLNIAIKQKSEGITSLQNQIITKEHALEKLQTDLDALKEKNQTYEENKQECSQKIRDLEDDNGRMRKILGDIYPLIHQLSNKFDDIAKQKPVEMESLMQLVTPIKQGLTATQEKIREFQSQNQIALADKKMNFANATNNLENDLQQGQENAKNNLNKRLQRRNETQQDNNSAATKSTKGGRSTRRRHKTKSSRHKKGGRKTKKSHRHKQKRTRKKK